MRLVNIDGRGACRGLEKVRVNDRPTADRLAVALVDPGPVRHGDLLGDFVLVFLELVWVVGAVDAVAGGGQLEGLHLEGVVVVLGVVDQEPVVSVLLDAL